MGEVPIQIFRDDWQCVIKYGEYCTFKQMTDYRSRNLEENKIWIHEVKRKQ